MLPAMSLQYLSLRLRYRDAFFTPFHYTINGMVARMSARDSHARV